MPTNYCPSCGAGTLYTTEKPKFCSKCGKGFDFSSAASSILARMSPAKKNSRSRDNSIEVGEDDYEDEQDSGEPVRGPRKIQLDFVVEDPRQKLEIIAHEQKVGDAFGREPKGKVNKKQWRKNFEQRMNTTTRIEIGGEE